ncbi:DUF6233 domain-containing protein [Streptomyces nanshensis]|uniref:Uncharacterized protein n=1 Tax=Streptomyces nanshensis TaxID=518642 RepID=A0A1E7L4E2_9ACTN|nr:DUF6233 domain-containing protein [Streptomyces nanshensis]OEV11049.1 hypothetical protein AN218_14750 [Streptomyces nanshensis]
MSEFPLPLPPDLERLQVIRAYLGDLQAQQGTIMLFLDLLAATVDGAIAAATPSGPPEGYRIQKMRLPEGRATLHRSDCWINGGVTISRADALLALSDDVTRGELTMCQACRPEEMLEP